MKNTPAKFHPVRLETVEHPAVLKSLAPTRTTTRWATIWHQFL